MSPEQAIRLIREMVRYRYIGWRKRSKPYAKGIFIRQLCIKIATRDQIDRADKIADPRFFRETTTRWVDVRKMISGQKRLAVWRMMYQLPRFKDMQRRNRPLVIRLPGGWFYIWDGNHRVTAAIMLGKTRMRCEVLRRRPTRRRPGDVPF